MLVRSVIPIFATLGLLLGSCCGSAMTGGGLVIGDEAPDFDLRGLQGTGGHALSDFRGDVVLVNFWASWCGPCRQEIPELETLWLRYKDEGLVVLSVNVDATARDAEAFLEQSPVSFPVVWDSASEVSNQYHVMTLPRSILVDRQGRVRSRYDGFDTSMLNTISTEIAQLLEESP